MQSFGGKIDPRPSNGNQKSNKMTLVMHYGIRITTAVYKNWIPNQYNTLLIPSLDKRETTLSTSIPECLIIGGCWITGQQDSTYHNLFLLIK